MRVVLDANVLVSALISKRGSPAEILSLWQAGIFEIVVSPPILDELERVIHYPRIQTRYNLPHEQVQVFLKLLSRQAILVEPQEKMTVITDDPAGNRYLECAIASQAQYIVSGDRHLLDLKAYLGIVILSPAGFLAMLKLGR